MYKYPVVGISTSQEMKIQLHRIHHLTIKTYPGGVPVKIKV
jgi:hypothetical protein